MHHKKCVYINYSKVTEEETAWERWGSARKQCCESGRGGMRG